MFIPWLIALFVNAQAAQSPVTVRSGTGLVEVTAVVVDKAGRPVAGLQARDFSVFEEGKPQEIALFYPSGARVPRKPEAAPLPANAYSNQSGGDTQTVGTVTAILLDSLNTRWKDMAYSRQQVLASSTSRWR